MGPRQLSAPDRTGIRITARHRARGALGSGMVRARLALAVGLVGSLVLGACAASTASRVAKATTATCPASAVPVVVSVDQWGDIVDQLAGGCGQVTTIFKSSSADPHDYEPTPVDSEKITGARLVVVNGLDYDQWADKVVATLGRKPAEVDAGAVVGLKDGDNPHLWYEPKYVYEVADAVTAALERLEPDDATYFERRHSSWRASMRGYDAEIARISAVGDGKAYGTTEGVFDYMAEQLGLRNATPHGYERATANESEPAPGDVEDFEQALAHHQMNVLIYNTQTEGAIPEEIRAKAQADGVPVVDVTESVPPQFGTFEAWQLSQLDDLAKALGA